MKERLVIALFAFAIAVNTVVVLAGFISVPTYYQRIVSQTATLPPVGSGFTNDSYTQEAAERGVSIELYAVSRIAMNNLVALIFLGVALLLVARGRQKWFAWYTASMFVFFAGYALTEIIQVANVIPWRVFGFTILFWFLLEPYFYPDGQAVPRRALWIILPLTIYHLVLQVVTALAYYVPEIQTQLGEINWRTGQGIVILPVVINFLIAFGCQVYRYARVTTAIQRQQTKWFLFGFGFFLLTSLVGFITGGRGGWVDDLVASVLGYTALPIALTIAVLRYRLWDIDLIIRRTLIYSILTTMLALVYFASIIVLQQIFRGITGQESDLALIVSTLAIAALFNPLRHRVQDTIDHRFYRRKYDAQQVLARFAATVRDEVELEKLTGELLNVVNETMQPTSVSLWLKKESRGK
jgi:hypothetical protein